MGNILMCRPVLKPKDHVANSTESIISGIVPRPNRVPCLGQPNIILPEPAIACTKPHALAAFLPMARHAEAGWSNARPARDTTLFPMHPPASSRERTCLYPRSGFATMVAERGGIIDRRCPGTLCCTNVARAVPTWGTGGRPSLARGLVWEGVDGADRMGGRRAKGWLSGLVARSGTVRRVKPWVSCRVLLLAASRLSLAYLVSRYRRALVCGEHVSHRWTARMLLSPSSVV